MSCKRLLATLSVSIALFLAACSSPQGPSLSASETGEAVSAAMADAQSVLGDPDWSQLPVNALGVVMTTGLPLATDGALPRGVYQYDAVAGEWAFVSASDDLDLGWTHDAVAYRLLFDWNATAPTLWVEDSAGDEYEVPAGGAATAYQAGSVVAAAAFTSGWFTNQCGYDEPSAGSLSGHIGGPDAMLSLDELALSITDTAAVDVVAAQAQATASVGEDSVSVYFDVTARGELERDVDCLIVDFAVQSGDVRAGIAIDVDGEQRSLDFATAFSDPEYEAGVLSGIGLNGSLRVDGVTAVTFVGALNDANDNGIPGDELLLTFADSETQTLEEFLLEQIGLVRLTALRLLAN